MTFIDAVYSYHETMLTHIILKIHFNSEIQQKLHDIPMSSWTSPVQNSPAVLYETEAAFKALQTGDKILLTQWKDFNIASC